MKDITLARFNFPALRQMINGQQLVFLDSAASSHRPSSVINAVTEYEELHHSNVHRGVHTLSQRATDMFENSRSTVARFINAYDDEVLFTSGTTEAINHVAFSMTGKVGLVKEILITELEHHANIVPWQMLCKRTATTKLVVVPVNDKGEVSVEDVVSRMNENTAFVSIAHVSNALGTILPIKQIIAEARKRDIPILIDGAQGICHGSVDVKDLDCDFYAFSSHKLYGPTGMGVLYAKRESAERWLEPWMFGGDMIERVSFDNTTFAKAPHLYEAGTPNISGAIGLASAIDYIEQFGMEQISQHENKLLQYMTHQLEQNDVRIIGTADNKASVISFVVDDLHSHDVGTILDQQGIAVRTGMHCAHPIIEKFGISGTVRASLAMYNTIEDVDKLIDGIQGCRDVLG